MKNQTSRQFLNRLAMRRHARFLNLALATCLFAGGAVSNSRAVDGTWGADIAGIWSDPGNWAGGVVAEGAGSTANFAFDITGTRTVTNDVARTIGNILFDDTGTGTDSIWTLAGTNINMLTFSGGSGTSTITANSTIAYGNEFSISALLAGTNNLVFNSTQTSGTSSQRYLQVTNASNSYSGTTTLANGFLDVGANSILAVGSPLGITSSAIILGNANTLVNTAGGNAPSTGLQIFASGTAGTNYTINRDIDSSATADVAGRTDVRFYNNSIGATGTMTVSSNWTLGTVGATHSFGLDAQQPGQTINFTGNILGAGVTQALRLNDYGQGNGTIRLSGANTYAGLTLVEEGVLVIGNNVPATGASPLGTNAAFQVGSSGSTSLNSALSNATISAVTDGAYTVSRNVTLGSSAVNTGATANLQQAYSWTLGGTSANATTFTGSINSTNVAFSRTLNVTQAAGGTTTFSGIVGANADASNVTTLEKTGVGTVVLSGPNTYDGGTRITGGTLLVNGGVAGSSSGTGTGSVSVGVVAAAQTAVSGSIVGPNSGTNSLVTRQINNVSLAVAAGLQVGQTVTGTNSTTGTALPAGTVVQSIAFAAGGTASVVISSPITVAVNATATFNDLAFGALTTSGTLGGSGVINQSLAGSLLTVNTGSTLAPGNAAAPGILTIVGTQTTTPGSVGTASVNLLAGSTLSIKLNGTVAGNGYDQLNVTGSVALGGGNLTLTLSGLTAPNGQPFTIINNDGSDAVLGTFANLSDGTVIPVGGQMFRINYNVVGGTDGIPNDVVLTAMVPEPGTWAMLVVGLGALGLAQYRRTRAA